MSKHAAKPWESNKGAAGGGSEADALATRFVASLDVDKRLYKVDIQGSIAHATMLESVGLITADDLAEIKHGLGEIEQEIEQQGDAWPGWKWELEDVHMCVEAALIEKTGDAGRKLHTGRSRNDQVATDLLLWTREAAAIQIEKINDVTRACVELSETAGRIVIPSYTHLQRAQPIVVGSELLAWAALFGSDRLQFELLLEHNDVSPLGSGAIAGSTLPLDSEHAAQLLGLREAPWNSMAFTASRDIACAFLFNAAMTAMHLSRWAEQWIIYASAEFGFITLDTRYTTGSSMMPQKQNPDMLELIRGKCGGVYGDLIALLTICKGLTIGYNRDLQEDKRHLFHAYDTVCDCLDMAARIVRTTRFNEDRIKATLGRGYLDATVLAEYLVTQGVPFRTAHQVVGSLVARSEALQLGELRKLPLDEFNKALAETPTLKARGVRVTDEVYDYLGAENVVRRYQTSGNAGLSGFEEQLRAWKERLGEG